MRSHCVIGISFVVEVLCLPYSIFSDGSVQVFLESFVWAVRVEALPYHLNVGLVVTFLVCFLIHLFIETSFLFCAPGFGVGPGHRSIMWHVICSDEIFLLSG